MKSKKSLAIVLRRTDFGEADRIVSLLTSEGKISAIARGARRQKSKLAGGIEIFAINEVMLAEGKSDLRTIISARMREFFGEILKDFDRTDFAYRAIQMISKYSENVENEDFYQILETTLRALNDFSIPLEITENWIYLQVFLAIGNQINLRTDRDGEGLVTDKKYNFDGYEKLFVASLNGKYDSDHIKLLRLMVVSDPRSVVRVKGVESVLKALRPVFGAIKEL